MSVTEWKDSFIVGVDEIDEQHKRLLKLINLLDDNIKSGCDRNIVYVIISEMREYTKYHFQTEERLIGQYKNDYQDYQAHLKEHSNFVNMTMDFFISYTSKDEKHLASEILNYLVKWFAEHSTGMDKGLARVLQKNGMSQ